MGKDTGWTGEKKFLEEIFTVENVLYMNFKGDIAFLVDLCLYLFEHQSSYNPNMRVPTSGAFMFT